MGKRVVHVLLSVGKQLLKVLLRTKRDMVSARAPADWLHGYIPGRRRESAVLIRQVTTWRLERLGMKSLTAFHDLTNAFGSVKWEAMDRAAERLFGPSCLGDHHDPGHGWGFPAQDWRRKTDGRPCDGGSVHDSLAACCGRRGSRVRTTACMASLVGWKG